LLLTNTVKEGTEMNKGDLVNAVAKVVCAKKEAVAAVDCVLDTIAKALKKGDKVTLVGFGTFSVAKRAARTGRNPKTGATIKIKAKKVPKFTAGKTLKDTVAK
jgi:DNA-binding protein HU-beta